MIVILPVGAWGVTSSTVGALIASRRPENAVGWILGASGFLFTFSIFSGMYAIYTLVMFGIPLSIGAAVLGYRLYDIDVLINRALVYGVLTAALALVYLGGVAASQGIFRALTGQEEQPQLAIVVSTLIIAALFNPLRRRIQSVIDRRFYRRKYNATKTLESFGARLRNEVELDTLRGDLVQVVRETLQPEHVSLWLRVPPRRSPGPEEQAR